MQIIWNLKTDLSPVTKLGLEVKDSFCSSIKWKVPLFCGKFSVFVLAVGSVGS